MEFDLKKINRDFIKNRYKNMPPIGYHFSTTIDHSINKLNSEIAILNEKYDILTKNTFSDQYYQSNTVNEEDENIFNKIFFCEDAIESKYTSLLTIQEMKILDLYHSFEKVIKSFLKDYLEIDTSNLYNWNNLKKLLSNHNVESQTINSINELRKVSNSIKHNLLSEPINHKNNILECENSTDIILCLSSFYERKYNEINSDLQNVLTQYQYSRTKD